MFLGESIILAQTRLQFRFLAQVFTPLQWVVVKTVALSATVSLESPPVDRHRRCHKTVTIFAVGINLSVSSGMCATLTSFPHPRITKRVPEKIFCDQAFKTYKLNFMEISQNRPKNLRFHRLNTQSGVSPWYSPGPALTPGWIPLYFVLLGHMSAVNTICWLLFTPAAASLQ